MIDNFNPDLEYWVVWSGGELLPPRPEKTSPSWNPENGEERRRYVQTGNHRRLFGATEPPVLPSPGEDQVLPETLEYGDCTQP